MLRRSLLLLTPAVLLANPANGDARLEKLYRQFIAPCCWRENLFVHHSPTVDELRTEIQRMIAAGKSDEQIKQKFVADYSIRILALPEGSRGQWLLWTPIAATAAGLAIVVAILRAKVSQPTAAPGPAVTDHLPEIEFE